MLPLSNIRRKYIVIAFGTMVAVLVVGVGLIINRPGYRYVENAPRVPGTSNQQAPQTNGNTTANANPGRTGGYSESKDSDDTRNNGTAARPGSTVPQTNNGGATSGGQGTVTPAPPTYGGSGITLFPTIDDFSIPTNTQLTLPPVQNTNSQHLSFTEIPDQKLYEGQLISFPIHVRNTQNRQELPTITVYSPNIPVSNKVFSLGPTVSGLYTWGWITQPGEAGIYEVTVRAADSLGNAFERTFTITVLPQSESNKSAPVIDNVTRSYNVRADREFTLHITGSDQDTPNEQLIVNIYRSHIPNSGFENGTVSQIGLPAVYHFTPKETEIGNQYDVTIAVSDLDNFYRFHTFRMTVVP